MGLGAVNPTRVAVTAWDWGAYLGEKGLKEGIRAKVSSFTRMHVNVNMVRGKITGQYINSILAKREAVLGGYDEAILLDISGFVAEASGENIFIANKKDIVRTPPLSSPILAGITRRTVLRLLKDMGHPVEEVTFTRDALYISNEVFFTGTRRRSPRCAGQPADRPGHLVRWCARSRTVFPGRPGGTRVRRVAHVCLSAPRTPTRAFQ
jgi:branched-chain amino acid aminotransferase